MIDKARKILLDAGWTMVGHFSGEHWTNGKKRVCISEDEGKVISHLPRIMSLDSFISTKGKGVTV